MDLENDGAAVTSAAWPLGLPPPLTFADALDYPGFPPQSALQDPAAASAEENEWVGGGMSEWAGSDGEEWGTEKEGESWSTMGQEGLTGDARFQTEQWPSALEAAALLGNSPLVYGTSGAGCVDAAMGNAAGAAAPPTPLLQDTARKGGVSASATVANKWNPLRLDLPPREKLQAILQEKLQTRGSHGSDSSCLTSSPTAATSAAGCASRQSLGESAGFASSSGRASSVIPPLSLPPSASFTAPAGTGAQNAQRGSDVSAAWFAPAALTATSASSVSPVSLMSALGSLQGKIAALQLLIPLVAQADPSPCVRQQQEAAAVGVAAVIQQVALAAVGLLPPRLQAQLLLPDIAGVVRADLMGAQEAAEAQAQAAQQTAQNADHSILQPPPGQQQEETNEALFMALTQAMQLQQQQHDQPCAPPTPLAAPTPTPVPAVLAPLPSPSTPFIPPAPAPSPPAPLLVSMEEGEEGEEETVKAGSKRGRDGEGEEEAANGEAPWKQAKVAEATVAAAAWETSAAAAWETASGATSGGTVSGVVSLCESASKAGASAGNTDTGGETETGDENEAETATAGGAASGSVGGSEGASEGGGEWQVIELRAEELTCDQMHFCDTCGKGFKREANLRMHMKAHGHDTTSRLALFRAAQPPADPSQCRFSCPVAGCKRHKQHAAFQPLKTVLCVRNHYRRSHCPKLLACSRCGGAKRFAVLADLRTHEKHCGRTSWTCSCGSCFSRKDKLMGHLAQFIGHSAVSPAGNRA